MQILAGTSRGVFSLAEGEAESQVQCVLESRGVRDLVKIDDRLFAGTGAGL